jgi:hypothetical protein
VDQATADGAVTDQETTDGATMDWADGVDEYLLKSYYSLGLNCKSLK